MFDRLRALPNRARLRRRRAGAFARSLARVVAAGGVFVCVVLCNGRAFGGELPEPIHFHFEVDASLANQCPDQARFMEVLRTELPRLTLAPDEARARTFDIRIRRGPKGLSGEVAVTSSSGGSYTRGVEARDCATLTRALAVMAAIASNAVPEEPAQEDADAPTAEVSRDATKAPSEPSESPVPTTRVRRKKARRPVVHAKAPPVWLAGVGGGTELVTGSLPQSAMGYRAYVDVARMFGSNALGGRLSVAYAGASLPGPTLLNVRIQTWTARLEGCLSRRAFAALSLEGCFGATSGIFEASSSDSPAGNAGIDPWLAFGFGARVRWHLGGPVYSELFSSLSIPTTGYDAISRDSTSLARFTVSQVVGEIGLGLGIEIRRTGLIKKKNPDILSGVTTIASAPTVTVPDLSPEERTRLKNATVAHLDFVWRGLRRLGVSPDDATDAAQEVFVVLASEIRRRRRGSGKNGSSSRR